MMRANLRMTANFDTAVAAQTETPGLTSAIIIDDVANLVHYVNIDYGHDDDGNWYRRLTYRLVSMINMKEVLTAKNRVAQELLYKIATALTGSTLAIFDPDKNAYTNRNFDKNMFILGANDGTWDDVFPTDKPEPKKAKPKAKASKGAS